MTALTEEAWWEQEYERTAPAPTLASQHSDWHAANGWANGCPLDCAASDPQPEPTEVESFYVELFSPGYCPGHPADAPF